jgi:hypothetical protein
MFSAPSGHCSGLCAVLCTPSGHCSELCAVLCILILDSILTYFHTFLTLYFFVACVGCYLWLTFLLHRSLSHWWWKRWVPPKCRFLQEPHCVTSQEMAFSVAFSPQVYYTDWTTATGHWILVSTFADRGVSCGQCGGTPMAINLSFLDWSRYVSFKQLLIYAHEAEWTLF